MDSLFSDPQFGVLPLVAGTFLVTLVAALVCAPFGLGSAIFLSEYAMTALERFWKPTLEILAGIPTVVYGYFALTFVTPLLQDIGFKVGPFRRAQRGTRDGDHAAPDSRVGLGGRDVRSATRPAARGVCARVDTDAGGDSNRRPCCDLGDCRLVRPRNLARSARP